MQTLSFSSPNTLSLYNTKQFLSLRKTGPPQLLLSPNSFCSNPLRSVSSAEYKRVMYGNKRRGFGTVCYSAPLSPRNLQWISTISSVVLMFARGTAIQKSFIVPIFALQAPASIVSWIKGEYGIWTAFLALLLRLFFYIPGELELPFIALLIVLVAPYQVMSLRGKQEGFILSLAIAGYLAFQHFSRAGSLRKAFDQVSLAWVTSHMTSVHSLQIMSIYTAIKAGMGDDFDVQLFWLCMVTQHSLSEISVLSRYNTDI